MHGYFYQINFFISFKMSETLTKTLRQKLNHYQNNTLNEIKDAILNHEDKDYIKDLSRKVQFKFKISEKSIATGSIYVNSLYYYFNDLWQMDNLEKTTIPKINTYLNLFEIYQSVFNTPEVFNDEALAEHWWKNHFISILAQIALKSGFSLPDCLYSIRRSTRTVISKATFNTTFKFFDNLKEKLKQKYCEKSIKYVLIFIDIFKYVFEHSDFIVVNVENEADVAKIQKELNEKLDNIQINFDLNKEIDADVEVENLELDDF